MDNAVYTFEQLLYQNMQEQSGEELTKTTHRCQDRVLKVNPADLPSSLILYLLCCSTKSQHLCVHSLSLTEI